MRLTALALVMAIFVAGFAFAGDQSLDMTRFEKRDGSTSFLHEEAGICAYAQLDGTIDLAKAEEALKTVEKSTSQYVIGSVGLEGYDESHDVHIYVDTDGWIIAYYLADEKASKIVNWVSFAESGSLMETKVRVALSYVCEQMLLFPSDIKHYDFRYPDATKMMIVADEESGDNVTETFRIKIPSDIAIYSRTCSFGMLGSYQGNVSIDGAECYAASGSAFGSNMFGEGNITISQLSPDEYHSISVWNNEYNCNGTSYGAIMLIYKE